MNSVFYIGSDEGKYALVIPHIQYLKQKDNRIEVVYNSLSSNAAFDINFKDSQEALDKWVKICKQIEDYYNAMMPQKDNNVDAAKEIILLQDEAKRAHEKACMLANFISVLYYHTMGDREIAPSHLEGKMERLEQWVADKAKEGK